MKRKRDNKWFSSKKTKVVIRESEDEYEEERIELNKQIQELESTVRVLERKQEDLQKMFDDVDDEIRQKTLELQDLNVFTGRCDISIYNYNPTDKMNCDPKSLLIKFHAIVKYEFFYSCLSDDPDNYSKRKVPLMSWKMPPTIKCANLKDQKYNTLIYTLIERSNSFDDDINVIFDAKDMRKDLHEKYKKEPRASFDKEEQITMSNGKMRTYIKKRGEYQYKNMYAFIRNEKYENIIMKDQQKTIVNFMFDSNGKPTVQFKKGWEN